MADLKGSSSETPEKSSKDGQFRSAAVGDRPELEDTLGFERYVQALKRFITHKNTKPPLTISIEGDWGVGKSSFMRQLKQSLDDENQYVTVEFNPWRHEKEDALWAAFMLTFIKELTKHRSRVGRWFGHVKLLLFRFDPKQRRQELVVWTAVTVFALLVLPLVALGGYLTYLNVIGEGNVTLLGLASVIGVSSGVSLVGLWRLWTNAVNLTQRELQKFIDDPEYENRVSFIERVHADISHVLNAYVGSNPDDLSSNPANRVFVFIDDLDRCAVPKAAELMQSIMLMLADDDRLVFIIGLDRDKVAAGVAAKHEPLLEYLAPEDDASSPLRFGYAYLEKFIQIPFVIPHPTPEKIEEFLDAITAAEAPVGTESEESVTVAGWNRELLREVVGHVAPALEYNPRQIKRFVNLYRLRAFLANESNFLKEHDGDLTLEQLGKFVAISLKWPQLLSEFDSNPDLLGDLYTTALRRELRRIQNTAADDNPDDKRADDEPTGDERPDVEWTAIGDTERPAMESDNLINQLTARLMEMELRLDNIERSVGASEARPASNGDATSGTSITGLSSHERNRLFDLLVAGLYDDPPEQSDLDDIDIAEATEADLESATKARPEYSMADLSVKKLLRVSPRADVPTGGTEMASAEDSATDEVTSGEGLGELFG